jgi:hypothetical protein
MTEIDGFVARGIGCSNEFLRTTTSPDERPCGIWPSALTTCRADGPEVTTRGASEVEGDTYLLTVDVSRRHRHTLRCSWPGHMLCMGV